MRTSNGTQAMDEYARLASAAIPITAGRPATLDGYPVALLHLDLARRPDVADLGRVLSVEGEGDQHSAYALAIAEDGRASIFLTVDYRRPVRCQFSVRLDPGTARDCVLLSVLAASGLVGITGGPLLTLGDWRHVVIIQTPASEVAGFLLAAGRCWTVLP